MLITGTVFYFVFAVPDIAPSEVGGGGGIKSELVITWEVSGLSFFVRCF